MIGSKMFKSKPVTIEAIQFTGGGGLAQSIVDWILEGGHNASWQEAAEPVEGLHNGWPERLRIETLEGWYELPPGHWVIKGLIGEFYGCDPEVFAAKYEETDEKPEAPKRNFLDLLRGEKSADS